MRSRWHAAATEPPADPCDEALAQVTAEQAALEKGMRELLAVRKPTEEHNREYCRMKANHVAVLKKQAEVGRARVEPMASPRLTLWEVQKNKLPLPAPGARALEPATPRVRPIPRKASTPQLFDGEGAFIKTFSTGSCDDDDSLRDEDELARSQFVEAVALKYRTLRSAQGEKNGRQGRSARAGSCARRPPSG